MKCSEVIANFCVSTGAEPEKAAAYIERYYGKGIDGIRAWLRRHGLADIAEALVD